MCCMLLLLLLLLQLQSVLVVVVDVLLVVCCCVSVHTERERHYIYMVMHTLIFYYVVAMHFYFYYFIFLLKCKSLLYITKAWYLQTILLSVSSLECEECDVKDYQAISINLKILSVFPKGCNYKCGILKVSADISFLV